MAMEKRDIKWADGLRGIAALLIVFHHLRVGFSPEYNSYPGRDRYLFHLPFLRIIVTGGNICVALFFLLSGFVCSIKALRMARQGEAQEARNIVAESIVRRIVRLVLPAAAATTASFLCSQWGLYEMAFQHGSPWMQRVKPPVEGFRPAIKSLFWNCVYTWTIGQNEYDGNQWTLRAEMVESMSLYLTLIATATFTPFWRLVALVAMLSLGLHQPDMFYANVCYFAGAILAELSFIIPSGGQVHWRFGRVGWMKLAGPVALALLGLYLGSYPEEAEDQMNWSKKMHIWGMTYLTGYNHQRLYSTIGGSFLILSLLLSPHLRHVFSHRYLVFLGGISYALYLLHATLMRSLLAYIIYSIPKSTTRKVVIVNHLGEQLRIDTIVTEVWRGWGIVRSLLFGVWMLSLLILAHFWRKKVDAASLILAKWLQEVASGKRGLLKGIQLWRLRKRFRRASGTCGEIIANGKDVEVGTLEKEVKD